MKATDTTEAILNGVNDRFTPTFTFQRSKAPPFSGELHIRHGTEGAVYQALVLVPLTRAHLANVFLAIQKARLPLIVLSDYVNPVLAHELRQADVAYLDRQGNGWIRTDWLYIDIEGRKRKTNAPELHVKRGKELFFPTGVRLIYVFLCQPSRVNLTYRELAELAGISLGSIARVFKALMDQDYLLQAGGKFKLVNGRDLLKRWVIAYSNFLRRKLYKGTFACDARLFEADMTSLLWGGEVAADRLMRSLKPQQLTLYAHSDKAITRLMMRGLLKAAEHGSVEVLEAFWSKKLDDGDSVHPVLIYADLIASGDPRNVETAEKLYDRYLARHLDHI